jgi:hypothetical protein
MVMIGKIITLEGGGKSLVIDNKQTNGLINLLLDGIEEEMVVISKKLKMME